MDHILMLDGALDRWTSDRIFKAREQGTFAGFGFATDESPPDAPRFRGLRFQITVLYLGTFAPLSTWETSEDPPLRRESMLGTSATALGRKGTMWLGLWRSRLADGTLIATTLWLAQGMAEGIMKVVAASMCSSSASTQGM